MRTLSVLFLSAALLAAAIPAGCARRDARPPAAAARPPASSTAPRTLSNAKAQVGMASWYGPGFAGKLTANGERFNPKEMTAAHRTHKFGTKLRVTNLANGKSVVVRVNDRGPFAKKRVIDVSQEAARRLDMIDSGVAKVRIEILD